VPSVAHGAYNVPYLTGYRAAVIPPPPEVVDTGDDAGTEEPPDAGPVVITYASTSFSIQLHRMLHVGVAAATTMDHWEPAFLTGTALQTATQGINLVFGNGYFLTQTN